MNRQVQCPVCRSLMSVPEAAALPREQTCAACGTSFELPLRRRRAPDEQDENEGDGQRRR